MKVGIIGAGAMGSIFAYFFNKTNMETVLFEKESNTIAAMKKGLNVIIDDKTESLNIEISDNEDILKDCKAIFVFVKTYSTEQAIKRISKSIDKDCILVTLQNGIGNREIIQKNFSEEKIVCGSTSVGATKLEASTVRLGGMGSNVIGGRNKEAVETIEKVLKRARFEVVVTDNPDIAIWKKAIINAGINPLGALLNIPNGMIIENEHSKKLQENIVREAVCVASAMGADFNADEMVNQTRIVCEKTAKNLCSMLQDVTAKRRTEIDNINGIIIEYGNKNKIDTRYNDAVYCLIKARELS